MAETNDPIARRDALRGAGAFAASTWAAPMVLAAPSAVALASPPPPTSTPTTVGRRTVDVEGEFVSRGNVVRGRGHARFFLTFDRPRDGLFARLHLAFLLRRTSDGLVLDPADRPARLVGNGGQLVGGTVTGSIDPETEDFRIQVEFVDGTGRFADAEGMLVLEGNLQSLRQFTSAGTFAGSFELPT